MTTAQVVETSVTVNNNSPIQNYVHPDDQTQPSSMKFRWFEFMRLEESQNNHVNVFHSVHTRDLASETGIHNPTITCTMS